MDPRIQKIRQFREFILQQIQELSTEKLNEIPPGFNNNIIWNLAHLICAQQSLCYIRAGQPMVIDEKYFTPYLTTTKPAGFIDEEETANIKNLFIRSIDKLQTDFDNNVFENYVASENIQRVYGVELKTIDDAFEFLLYHEGFHSGYITSLIRLVR